MSSLLVLSGETCLVPSSPEDQLSELGEDAEMYKNDMYDSVPVQDKGFSVRGPPSGGDIAFAEDDSIVSEI